MSEKSRRLIQFLRASMLADGLLLLTFGRRYIRIWRFGSPSIMSPRAGLVDRVAPVAPALPWPGRSEHRSRFGGTCVGRASMTQGSLERREKA
jgi:hypothetical protein